MHRIRNYVLDGGNFLMIGGWESFHGLNGEYNDTPVADVLPVILGEKDDRVNYGGGVLVFPGRDRGPVPDDLDWEYPPLIGGYNAFTPKRGTRQHLYGKKIRISGKPGKTDLQLCGGDIPLFVSGRQGKGRSAALAFDLAPHWIGPMVDWGSERKHVDLEAGFIEVGDMYYRFVSRLLKMMTTNSEGINKRSERL
ncbi:MAG: glutamine amidotransferase [Candidatus Marinimicrobia bacterium]|nr:glutamine amidotransferase [Candidatus Neomarinimicrobiota bacterium]